MSIATRKIKFIQSFLNLSNEKTLTLLESILKGEGDFNPMSIEELNRRIDQSEEDFKQGRFKSQEDLVAQYE